MDKNLAGLAEGLGTTLGPAYLARGLHFSASDSRSERSRYPNSNADREGAAPVRCAGWSRGVKPLQKFGSFLFVEHQTMPTVSFCVK